MASRLNVRIVHGGPRSRESRMAWENVLLRPWIAETGCYNPATCAMLHIQLGHALGALTVESYD